MKLYAILSLILVLALCGSMTALPGPAPRPQLPAPTPMISINFDDGFLSAYELGLPLVEAAGYKVTEFIITGKLGTPTYVTAAQVLDEESRGHEIQAHTRTHPHLSTLTADQQQDEIEGSKEDLTALLGHVPQHFAYPYGDYNATTLSLVQQDGFVSARSINADSLTQNMAPENPFLLYSQGLSNTTTLADVQYWIDLAQTNRTWLILVFHRVDEDGNIISVTHELLQGILSYIQQKKLPVVTITQGLNALGLAANVTASPAAAAFGNLPVGTSSTPMLVTLTNHAPHTLDFTSPVEITGPDAADFRISTTTCGMPVSGNGGVCRTMVVFTPSTVGPESASLSFTDNGNPSMLSAALTGTGTEVQPVTVTVSPAATAFGSLPVGTSSAAVRVTLTNLAPKTLDFTSPVAITGPNAADFTISTTTCGMPVSGNGGVCRTMVAFTPSVVGPESAALTFMNSGHPPTISAALTGTGTAAQPPVTVTVSPATAMFGSLPLGTPSAAIRVTLTNLASKTLDFTWALKIAGPNAADFTISSTTCGLPVSGNGGVCRTMVVFTPSVVGPESASLVFMDNGNPATISAALTGTGTAAPTVTVSPPAVTFGSLPLGTPSAAIRVTLTNLAPKTLDFTSTLKITGPNAADFTISSTTCGMPVSGNGGVCRTMIVFTPSKIGSESASLSFVQSGNPSTISAALTGTGTTEP